MMMRTLVLVACLATALSGCAGDSGTQSHGVAKVSYEGNDPGMHDDSADCDDDATLVGTGSIDEGSIRVRVTDGDGQEQFSHEYDGDVTGDAEHMDGASGDWTLSVTRLGDSLVGGDFDGSYTFTLSC